MAPPRSRSGASAPAGGSWSCPAGMLGERRELLAEYPVVLPAEIDLVLGAAESEAHCFISGSAF